MYLPISRNLLRSAAESLRILKSYEHVRRNLDGKFEFSRFLTTSVGSEFWRQLEESKTKPFQVQIVDALRLGERTKASDLLLNFGGGNFSPKVDDFIYILKYCARSPDPLFVMETLRVMEDKNIKLNNISFMLTMQALCKGGYLEEASHLINFVGESSCISPMLPVYNIFLGACAKMKSIVHANKCLDLMEHRMVGKNEITYSELLKLAVWQQNLFAVHEIWKDYVKQYSMSIISLRKFIWSFTRLGDLKSAYETLQHMVALAVRGKLFINTNVEGKLYSSRLDIPIPSNGEVVLKEDSVVLRMDSHVKQCTVSSAPNREIENTRMCLLSKYKSMPIMKVLRWSFSDVIHACAQAQNSGLAEELMQQMQNIGLQPSSHTFDGFVRAIVHERGFSDGVKALKLMRQWNLKPYDPTLLTISIDCSRALELDLSEALLDEISECLHPHAFNALLAACDIMDQPERAVRVFAKMKQLKLQPDIRTYELLFSLFGNVNAPYEEGNMLSQVDSSKRINAIELDMAKNGLQHSHQSMKSLLKALGAEGMMRELIQYLHVAENLFCGNNTYFGMPIYKTVLHALVEAKEIDMAIEIFKNMRACGFPLDAAIYNIMIDCCSIIRCFRSACALVSMMIRNGFYPQTITYTALTKILLEDENFDEAWILLDQASSEGNQIDAVFYNSILQKACEKGRIDVIEFITEQMHRDKVQPDPSTCQYVFTSYVDRGFHSTAVEALSVLSMRMLCEEENVLQEKRTEFEDLILSEDSEAESQILKFFKDSEENLAIAMLNLRWCTIVGFKISWSRSPSQWAKRLSTNYDFRRTAL